MAAKPKHQAGKMQAAPGVPLRQEVDRLIAKGRFKDAVKQAKLCFRQEGTPEHHRLLERAYFLRTQQLQQGGMPTAAQEVALHLLEFGITDPTLTEPAAALLLAVGLAGRALELQGRLDDPEARERLQRQAADQAVLHPERASAATPPEVRAGAMRVRAALGALEAGDGAKAMAELGDVARNSPFADWKLFARGLAAYQGRDDAAVRANWGRLDPARAPARIARALMTLAAPDPGDKPAGSEVSPKLEGLERRAFGEPILGPIRELGTLVAQDRWEEAVRMMGPVRFALRRIDPALAVRMTRVLYDPLIRAAGRMSYHEGHRLIRSFVKAAEPLPVDPHWNRLWALVWEGPQGSIGEAEVFWRKYLDDLKAAPGIQQDERPRAQALVWLHLGEGLADLADALAPEGPGPRRVDAEVTEARRRAVDCLEESVRLCPTLRDAHEALMDVYDEWGRPDDAAAAAGRRLRAFPDDCDALVYLSQHHYHREEFAQALDFAQRARALKPLDDAIAEREWGARVGLARDHALHGRFDDGRAEFAAAARLRPELARGVHFLARRAALELKAGQADLADELIAEAQGHLAEPTPLWLAMLIEAKRFKLPKAERDRFEALWVNALAKKCRGETAGALAELLGAFVAGDVVYPGRDEHVRQVVEYLRRTTRTKYRREELAKVCSFLGLARARGSRELFEKFARRGLKLFPEAPEFSMMLGSVEMEKGPFGGNLYQARKHFAKALELAEAQQAREPHVDAMVPKIREALSGLDDLMSGPMGFPFGPFGRRGGPASDLFEMFDVMDIDPDDPFGTDDDAPAPAPRPRRKGRKA